MAIPGGGFEFCRLALRTLFFYFELMSTKFVTNDKGKKIAAILPIREYEDLLQDAYSAAIIERRKNEKAYPWEDLKRKLIEDGTLSH